MTSFQDRERAEEAKFAHDEEMQFRVHARRNRLLGAWAAEKMGLSAVEAEGYAKGVVQADFEESGDEDVIRKLLGDLTSAKVEIDEAEIRAALQSWRQHLLAQPDLATQLMRFYADRVESRPK